MIRKYTLAAGNLHFEKYTQKSKKSDWKTEIRRYDWRWERQNSRYHARCPFRFINNANNNEPETKHYISYECTSNNEPLPEEKVMRNLMISKMHISITCLSDLEQHIIRAYYFNYQTDLQISKSIGKSRQTITRLRHKALVNLRNLIDKHI